ncbi:helix-turn-helix domain-containing protein [Nitrosomonas sp. Nm166]|uniref:helix-turn-helix domain-containing protein n=1 Tax=Nitrosomonas sp. Nm166 TaxID=1881054 RepID=UPI0008DED8C0|nr:helix-turn-helix domain-containing protein [Nitrosomonas sp. Nm166]SFF27751.1 DNA binding domain-containing protein, excisionase family [Nitrosomonas sp. Nm166]
MTAIQKIINDPNKPRLTEKQAAEYLGVSKKTLDTWRLTKRHIIPYHKMGGMIRYSQSDLDIFLQTPELPSKVTPALPRVILKFLLNYILIVLWCRHQESNSGPSDSSSFDTEYAMIPFYLKLDGRGLYGENEVSLRVWSQVK